MLPLRAMLGLRLFFLVVLKEEVVVGVLLYVEFSDTGVEHLPQFIDVRALDGADEQTVAVQLCHPGLHEVG